MREAMTCAEATVRLLERYGVSTVFGIPGVHTLDFCRGLDQGVRHIQARNEQGAGFMAEGWARATGEPGVALVISGPGVTNASTALGQAYADSLPLLLISADAASSTIGKGWGVLHEITDQTQMTKPLTGFSATARRAQDVPELLARAFTLFASQRPRPVHISIPIDVQAEQVDEDWQPVTLPGRPKADPEDIAKAVNWLKGANSPLIMVGGGACGAGAALSDIAERTGAIVISSTAGKGIISDDHPLSLSASTVRPEVLHILSEADVILAVGTELSETDSFVERMNFNGRIIRIDIDPSKINDVYPADLGIVADAQSSIQALCAALEEHRSSGVEAAKERARVIRSEIRQGLSVSERQHVAVLDALAEVAPADIIWSGDACQLVYTGAFAMPVHTFRKWFYPAGYCALGNALPNAIGARLARPETPVAVLVGDGGFMFTMPELLTAAELNLPIPIIIWENGGLKQIQDDMDQRQINRVGVEGANPDFVALARACHAHAVDVDTHEALQGAFVEALQADRPTVIVCHEDRN
jgi:5-guanidino-2-oxopentanoate decarboxylase